jgi:hypothetical protein
MQFSYFPPIYQFLLSDPDKQDKCVNEVFSACPNKRNKRVHEISSAKTAETISNLLKAQKITSNLLKRINGVISMRKMAPLPEFV